MSAAKSAKPVRSVRSGGRTTPSLALWLGLALLVVVADQLSKTLIMGRFGLGDSVTITPWFNLVRAHNAGAAFSFLADASGWQRWFFAALAVGMSALLTVWLARTDRRDWRQAAPFALVIGGALGNLVDRLVHGHVIDFIDAYWGTAHWPAFNIADSAIVIGAIGIALVGFLPKGRDW